MHRLRSSSFLVRLVLMWFALTLGAAFASPVIHSQALEIVCSGSGAVKLLVKGESQGDPSSPSSAGAHFSHDCPLCSTPAAPPPGALRQDSPPLTARADRPSYVAEVFASRAAAPLPARGPPSA